jgi:hypothetical protein
MSGTERRRQWPLNGGGLFTAYLATLLAVYGTCLVLSYGYADDYTQIGFSVFGAQIKFGVTIRKLSDRR